MQEKVISTDSVLMAQAIDHTNRNGRNIEMLVHDLVMQWMGPYENAQSARNWSERNAIYTRNAHRKTTRVAMEEYFSRDGSFSGDNLPADQNNDTGATG